jgi:hypothetical protein
VFEHLNDSEYCNATVYGATNQDALRVYDVHQPLALTSLPGNSWQSP